MLGTFHRNQAGYTLPEVMVMLGIITILGGVAAPKLTGLIGNAATVAQSTELSQVQKIVDTYMVMTARTTLAGVAAYGTLTPENYATSPYKAYFRTPPACNYTITADGKVSRDTSGQPATCFSDSP